MTAKSTAPKSPRKGSEIVAEVAAELKAPAGFHYNFAGINIGKFGETAEKGKKWEA